MKELQDPDLAPISSTIIRDVISYGGDINKYLPYKLINYEKFLFVLLIIVFQLNLNAQTNKPILHGKHWIAITGKPLGATSGAMIFSKGGNAVDAACAMVASTATMWDVLGWGGETQALIYHPKLKKVIGINALGVAPSGATPEYYREKGFQYPQDLDHLQQLHLEHLQELWLCSQSMVP